MYDQETHLIPILIRAAFGHQEALDAYGSDCPTPNGSAIRDYICVSDLAQAHLSALYLLRQGRDLGPINLGSNQGFSVLEVLHMAETVLAKPNPHRLGPRPEGYLVILVAINTKAKETLGWTPGNSDLPALIRSTAVFLQRHWSCWGSTLRVLASLLR